MKLGRKSKTSSRALNLEQLEHRHLLAADVFITEFSASNSSLEDSFGETPDWVELYNNGDTATDLSNYYLTDNAMELDKWVFPSRMIDPGEFVVVFASSRDTVVGDEIHTNFNLSREGEYLGLVESDGVTVKQDFGEMYPEQDDETTYGLSMESDGNFTTILNGGATASYLIPNNGNLGSTWTELGFNDGAWSSGPLGLGYENSPADYQNLINTTVPSGTTSTYVRIPFT
ncbi:MAG: lamin tail domain-containing protein, partial [Planctomycetota bacterium]